LRFAERKSGDGFARGEPGDPSLADLEPRRAEDRVAAEPLERERCLGLGASVREALT
jgi:hypothetical protein